MQQSGVIGVFRASERTLGDVMRPRPDVDFVEAESTIAEVADFIATSSHSRYPVIEDTLDDVLGVVHIRDLLTVPADERAQTLVRELTRDITALPETKLVLPTLKLMREDKTQMALVIDEHGGTAGVVTIEDLVEEIVGEIYDEYDTDPDPEDALVHQGGSALVPGALIVEELEEALGLSLPQGSYETVGGLILARLGRVAEVGDEVELDGVRLQVTAVEGRRITEVEATREAPSEGGVEEDGSE